MDDDLILKELKKINENLKDLKEVITNSAMDICSELGIK